MADLSPLAGLHVAPPYDKSKELDPDTVVPVAAPFDVAKLEYFQKRQERRTWMARMALLGSMVFLICMNIWSGKAQHEETMAELQQNRSELEVTNKHLRMELSQLREQRETQFGELVTQNALIWDQVLTLEAQLTEATGEAAETPEP